MIDLAEWVRPGDGVVVGEGSSEAVPLLDAAARIEAVRLWAGMQFRPVPQGFAEVWSFGAAGTTRRVPDLRIVPCHFSALPRLFAARAIPGDVALVQLAPPDADGRCSFGIGADYLADAAASARTVIAEVNAQMPATRGPSLAYDELDAVFHTDRPLLEAPVVTPTDRDRAIAAHVAGVVQDGDTLQLGIGGLPEAVLRALHGHKDLGVHSGFVSEGVLDLLEAGVITRGVTTGIALGSARLFAACAERDDVTFAPTSVTHAPAVLAGVAPLAAINSALEVDASGQVGSEAVDGRFVGAVGGQLDFLRAAVAGGGRGIIALPAAQLVEALSGPVTVPRADVDWIVTENGAARLHGLGAAARASALQRIA